MSVHRFPSRAVEGQALWCPALEHVGPRLWRMGYARMTEAVCHDCHEARLAAARRPEWWRHVGAAVSLLLLFLLLALGGLEPVVSPHESAWPAPAEGGR